MRALRKRFVWAWLLAVAVVTLGSRGNLRAEPQASLAPTAGQPDRAWIERSNQYTELLLDITKKHSPESASAEGLAQFDEQISQPHEAGR